MKEILFLVCCFFSLNDGANDVETGTKTFKDIVTSRFFVDKTMFIKEFLEHEFLEISIPRRFGKTVNMDMLKSFFEIQTDINGTRLPVKDTENYKIFNGTYNGEPLKIRKDSEFFDAHFGKYPVLHVNFRELDTSSLAKFMQTFSNLIFAITHKYRYLWQREDKSSYLKKLKLFNDQSSEAKLNDVQCGEALKFMSLVLNTEFNEQVIVLIDEYDAPIQKMIFSGGKDIKKITDLINDIIANVLKGNPFVTHGLLNSCIKVAGVLSPYANHIQSYQFTGNIYFSEYYGFTTKEVDMLLSRLKIEADRRTLETWYNGYTAIICEENRTQKLQLYNPFSITKYCESKFFKNYWADRSFELNLRKLSFESSIFNTICKLLENNTVTIVTNQKISIDNVIELKKMILTSTEINKDDHDLYFHMLLQLGYLTITDMQEDQYDNANQFVLKIPNRELRREIRMNYASEEFLIGKFHTQNTTIEAYLKSLSNLNDKKSSAEAFLQSIIKICENITLKNENDIQSILYAIPLLFLKGDSEVYCEVFLKEDEHLNTTKKIDVLIITANKKGIIIETKFNDADSTRALVQIIEGKYFRALREPYRGYIKEEIFIGLHSTKKKKFSLSYLYCSEDMEKAIHIPEKKQKKKIKKKNNGSN